MLSSGRDIPSSYFFWANFWVVSFCYSRSSAFNLSMSSWVRTLLLLKSLLLLFLSILNFWNFLFSSLCICALVAKPIAALNSFLRRCCIGDLSIPSSCSVVDLVIWFRRNSKSSTVLGVLGVFRSWRLIFIINGSVSRPVESSMRGKVFKTMVGLYSRRPVAFQVL